ncbi:hypothetical protein AVEN_116818-1 [Araneus ventricosus]|uniref:Secreted protein n=1 Tax=Araneus ventricosus TaxID=182803 RepID=A0A4Y2NWS7_ARAVE|nr:hypothetical protein AVEN_116818-1 [Araneus ventricosus]
MEAVMVFCVRPQCLCLLLLGPVLQFYPDAKAGRNSLPDNVSIYHIAGRLIYGVRSRRISKRSIVPVRGYNNGDAVHRKRGSRLMDCS